MGVKGLLPFLKSITKEISLSQIRDCTVAVDAYCWLHKAAICCSDKIAFGEDTDMFLTYCMKYIDLLLLHNINVILVFDGQNLPAKLDIENKRQGNRESFHQKGMMLANANKLSEAKECFDKCVEISHKIAVKLIKKAQSRGLKCIVAPYEADAQLAYLCKNKIVDYVITEDSDLLLFGTPKVLYKLDLTGHANLIENNDINKVLKFPIEKYSFNKFRYICIIAGCDYFPGIFRVGLATAVKIMQKTSLIELSDFLSRINMYSKTKIILSPEEIIQAVNADLTFQYQIVFDPITCQQVPLNNYPVGMSAADFAFAGKIVEDKALVMQLATGIRDPTNHELVPDFDCDSKLLNSNEMFHFGRSKSMVVKPSTDKKENTNVSLNRGKSVQVKCQFPWKDLAKSYDPELEMQMIFETYGINNCANDVNIDRSFDEKVNSSSDLCSNEESAVNPTKPDTIEDSQLTNNSIIRKRSSQHISNDKENKVKKSRPQSIQSPSGPGSKKTLIQAKLSHLFKSINKL